MPPIIHLPETDSTNNYLKQLIVSQYIEEGTIVCTDYQTSGRGQRGNGWEAEKGLNLLFSLVLYPHQVKANEQFIISQLVALAIKNVLSRYTDGITIKWSNDIYWNDKKICGILIENSLLEENIQSSVIGIGININQTNFESNAPNPISLKKITDKTYECEIILSEISEQIQIYYAKVRKGESDSIIKEYKDALYRREGYHLYNDGDSDFYARIADIEPSGLLVLETKDGYIRRFAFKEVKFTI